MCSRSESNFYHCHWLFCDIYRVPSLLRALPSAQVKGSVHFASQHLCHGSAWQWQSMWWVLPRPWISAPGNRVCFATSVDFFGLVTALTSFGELWNHTENQKKQEEEREKGLENDVGYRREPKMCVIYVSAPVSRLNVGCPQYAHVWNLGSSWCTAFNAVEAWGSRGLLKEVSHWRKAVRFDSVSNFSLHPASQLHTQHDSAMPSPQW